MKTLQRIKLQADIQAATATNTHQVYDVRQSDAQLNDDRRLGVLDGTDRVVVIPHEILDQPFLVIRLLVSCQDCLSFGVNAERWTSVVDGRGGPVLSQ